VIPRRGEAGAALGAAGTPGTAAPAGVGEAPGAGGRGKQISLATATPAQLDTLEGIGPKLAGAIIAYRNRHHGFKSIEELREVDGIGEKRFAAIRDAVRP